ncbi:gastrula zinc finger protein XlCGF57.1-like isoform X2 [Silurus meridionalis]|nr:gastrula zinc finger protein XlCGF57.1-like isoform X2 [Silurus meridionalis]
MSWRCSVRGCGKRNQAKAKDVVIHRFPEKDPELCATWMSAIGRDANKTQRKYASLRVCSQHFTPDDYERDLKAELLGCPPKKLLKKTAVPSIFQGKRKPGRRQTPSNHQPQVSFEKENAPAPLSTCSDVEEMSWLKAIKSLQTPQGSNIFKSREVMVNTQCLLELFQFCWLCQKECCITIEGNEKLFSVVQDCQSCGYHREWRSRPPSTEPSHSIHNEVVVQTGSSGNERSKQSHEQVSGQEDVSCLSSNDEGASLQEEEAKTRKEEVSSDEPELHSDDEAKDSDVSMDEDLFTALKEEGQGKLLVWCTQCRAEASLSCSVRHHKKWFCCAQCGTGDACLETLPVRFEDVASFQNHAEQEHGSKPFYILCQDCGKFVLANKEHVCEHKVKFVVCPECGKRFLTEGGLKTHYTQLHSDYDHPCKYCLKVFKTRSTKLEHEQTHPKENQPYSCPDCPQKFGNIYKRNEHVRSHRGPHKYACGVCKKGFRDINRLRRHKLIHSGEKPFKCQVCERSFNRMENLGAHMRVHTGERPFTCEQCGESFSHNVSLKNHKQRNHDSGSPPEKELGNEVEKEVLHDVENKLHVTIQNGGPIQLVKCVQCCSKYHCPFCKPEIFKPTVESKVRKHLKAHEKRAVRYKGKQLSEYAIFKCGLNCKAVSHFHCPKCSKLVEKKNKFLEHLDKCVGTVAHEEDRENLVPVKEELNPNHFSVKEDVDSPISEEHQSLLAVPVVELHVTIQNGGPIQLVKCVQCCSKYHCPFCKPEIFKPTVESKDQDYSLDFGPSPELPVQSEVVSSPQSNHKPAFSSLHDSISPWAFGDMRMKRQGRSPKKECCITIDGNEKLFSVMQDCQSCGYHREWRSRPPLTEPPHSFNKEEKHAHEDEDGEKVVAQIVSSDAECSEKVFIEKDGSYLSTDDAETHLQKKAEKRKRKRKSESKSSSDNWESCLDEWATDSDVSMDKGLFTVLKEDGPVKWCTQCRAVASLSCSVHQHKKLFCCAQCGTGDGVRTHCIETLPVRFEDVASFQNHAEQEHGSKPFYKLCQDCGKVVLANPESRGLKKHKCEPKSEFIVCPECGKRFLTEMGLKSHYTRLHSYGNQVCETPT